jgi:selenocysteine lyase/cysteine desulfurase
VGQVQVDTTQAEIEKAHDALCADHTTAVYLDCAATTPLDPRVAAVVRRLFEDDCGNAGSRTHDQGRRARRAVEHARDQVAAVAGVGRGEVVFTPRRATTSRCSAWRSTAFRPDAATW